MKTRKNEGIGRLLRKILYVIYTVHIKLGGIFNTIITLLRLTNYKIIQQARIL